MNVGEAVARFVDEWSIERDIAPNTRKFYRCSLRVILRDIQKVEVSNLSKVHILALLSHMQDTWSYGTRQRYRIVLKLFLVWLSEQHLTEANLGRCIKFLVARRPSRPILTPDELGRMVAQLSSDTPVALRDRTIVLCTYYAALRSQELRDLRLRDYLPTQKPPRLYVNYRGIKREKSRYLPLRPRAANAIEVYLAISRPALVCGFKDSGSLFIGIHGGPISAMYLQRLIPKLAEKAGIGPRITPHILRHSMADRLGSDPRMSAWNLQDFLGHRSMQSTLVYVHTKDAEVAAAYDAVLGPQEEAERLKEESQPW